jgi:hypothetical protein
MHGEKRTSKRKPLHQRAWITAGKGASVVDCTLSDISESGARIKFEKPGELPEGFILMFTANGQPSRWCRVVWRSDSHVGVRFDQMTRAEAVRVMRLSKVPNAQ